MKSKRKQQKTLEPGVLPDNVTARLKPLGAAIWATSRFVVRVREDEEGCHVYVHRRAVEHPSPSYGKEILPKAYFLGNNALLCRGGK